MTHEDTVLVNTFPLQSAQNTNNKQTSSFKLHWCPRQVRELICLYQTKP